MVNSGALDKLRLCKTSGSSSPPPATSYPRLLPCDRSRCAAQVCGHLAHDYASYSHGAPDLLLLDSVRHLLQYPPCNLL